MLRNRCLLISFVLVSVSVIGQSFDEKELEGKVYSADGDVAATHVMNTTTQRAAITDIDGFFKISAKLGDTIVFSAVQYKRKEIVVSLSILESSFFNVPLEEALTELDEVIVMPYNLTGDMTRDVGRIAIDPVVTSSTLGLPNAYAKPLTKAERQLYAATANRYMSFDPLINAITGRTKQLKNQVKREKAYSRTERVKAFYADSLIVSDLRIPEKNIDDFMYFCEIDSTFQATVDTHDKLRIWEVMKGRSAVYRENNELD